jgi:exopolysaccharide production protein ExoY
MTDLIRTLPLPVERSEARTIAGNPRVALAVKRTLDVTVAVLAVILAAPLLLLIALLVRLDSPGPALFRQTRVGAGGRRFRILKFRTMVKDAEEILAGDPELRQRYEANNFKLAIADDPRVTRVGRFLRQMSLDELPQLWNVLRGDMSMVGVRPVPEQHYESFGPAQSSYTEMRPGITGLWQVNGRHPASMAATNSDYVGRWSLGRDFRIMLKTLPAVISRRGAH